MAPSIGSLASSGASPSPSLSLSLSISPSPSSSSSPSFGLAPAAQTLKLQDTSASKAGHKFSAGPIDKRKRLAANARERKRMNLLNKAYDQLRKRLNDAENKSKYDVLVQAKEYIQALAKICADFDRANPGHPSAVGAAMANARPATWKPEPKLESASEPATELACPQERHRDHSRLITMRPAHCTEQQQQQQQLPIQSPGSSSDSALSPMSLPESVASSTSSHCSSLHLFHHNHIQHQQQQSQPIHHQLPLTGTKAAFLLQTARFKQEQMDELSSECHQIYRQHYHSFFHIQKQATL